MRIFAAAGGCFGGATQHLSFRVAARNLVVARASVTLRRDPSLTFFGMTPLAHAALEPVMNLVGLGDGR